MAASGVPAPAPAIAVEDTRWIGSPFLAMPLLRELSPARHPCSTPTCATPARPFSGVMHDELIDTVAAVHAVDWAAAGLNEVLPGPSLGEAVDRWQGYVEWSSEGEPLPRWRRPWTGAGVTFRPSVNPCCCGGTCASATSSSTRNGRVIGVLDWDLAAVGPREMDLGWHLGLEYMMDALFGQRVPGFPGPVETVARYEDRTGYEVRALGWHEVFALVRALAINDRHQRITADARRRDNPMGTILMARLEAASAGTA